MTYAFVLMTLLSQSKRLHFAPFCMSGFLMFWKANEMKTVSSVCLLLYTLLSSHVHIFCCLYTNSFASL